MVKVGHEHVAIGNAIATSRGKTSAQIRLVVTDASSHYGSFAMIHALTAALIAGIVPVVAFPALPATHVIMIEFAAALIALACLQNRWLRHQLVPKATLRKAAWRHARLAYAHIRLQSHGDAPLVVLYCSRLERYVEILTEDKVLGHVPSETWQRIIEEFKPHMQRKDEEAAFIHLIERSTLALAPFFPAG